MFTLGLREGLAAAAIVALIATIARGTPQLRSVWRATCAGVALSAVLVPVVRTVLPELSETTRHGVKAVVALGAVMILTSTVRWASVLIHDAGGMRTQALAAATPLAGLALLAITREGLELAIFPAAGAGDRWGPGGPAMVLGVLVAAAIVAVAHAALRRSPAQFALVTSITLVLIAAGMVAAAVRSLDAALGWSHPPLFELGWAGDPDTGLPAGVKGLLGLHGAPTALEIACYSAYLGAMVATAWVTSRPHGAQTPGDRLSTAGTV